MKAKFTRVVLFFAAIYIGSAACVRAAKVPEFDAAVAFRLITAIEVSDYAAFVMDGEEKFKELKKAQFEAVATRLAPRLTRGHEISYLGELRQNGYRVTLWKVSFKDGGDDALATLSMKDGKVGGFWIR